jgi:hypothetical protein
MESIKVEKTREGVTRKSHNFIIKAAVIQGQTPFPVKTKSVKIPNLHNSDILNIQHVKKNI